MIYVFKTSVTTKTQVSQLKPHIDRVLLDGKWIFDLQDCDNILRIDCEEEIVAEITQLLRIHDYDCEELH